MDAEKSCGCKGDSNMKVLTLTKENFEAEKNKKGVLMVDFWAEWCGPCKMMMPIVGELANDVDGKARVAKINIDEEPEIAQEFGVMSIPTFITFKNGEEVAKEVGARPKAKLLENINDNI